jgi:hypothetical protein
LQEEIMEVLKEIPRVVNIYRSSHRNLLDWQGRSYAYVVFTSPPLNNILKSKKRKESRRTWNQSSSKFDQL